jgi:hypothetical protein
MPCQPIPVPEVAASLGVRGASHHPPESALRTAGNDRANAPDQRSVTNDRYTPAGAQLSSRCGFTLTEAIVIIVIIALTFLILLMMVPQGREQARLVACRKNLGQIGIALALYDQSNQQLPAVVALPAVDGPRRTRSAGPLRTLLETLQLPDLTELQNRNSPPKARPGQVPVEAPVPGFVCASDPNATAGNFAAPISYRATTGDSPPGENGAFAPGRVIRLRDVEAADGLSYTAGFSECLVGDNQAHAAALGNYFIVPGPLSGRGCPGESALTAWRGDSGRSWAWADHRFTLYNHALVPSVRPCCVASDGKSAFMSASSGHVRGINMLLLDGSVNLVRPTIATNVWREFARINPAEPAEPR